MVKHKYIFTLVLNPLWLLHGDDEGTSGFESLNFVDNRDFNCCDFGVMVFYNCIRTC